MENDLVRNGEVLTWGGRTVASPTEMENEPWFLLFSHMRWLMIRMAKP